MDAEIETSLKECMLKLKDTALTLALTHHKTRHIPELTHLSRDIADALANVSSLALIIQGTFK
jgi:hypothetical protein